MTEETTVAVPHEDYIRVAAGIPSVRIADVAYNLESIASMIAEAAARGAMILVLPELSLTAYTCADLFQQHILMAEAVRAIGKLRNLSSDYPSLLIAAGAPLEKDGLRYNCAVIICGGKILGAVPKSFLPNYAEFYEKRWFVSGSGISSQIMIGDEAVPFGTDLLFSHLGEKIGVEICEDLWSPNPPDIMQALSGATVLLNLSASDEVIGKHEYLLSLIKNQSASLHAAYVYASAGAGESSTDLVFAGNAIIAENGRLLQNSERFIRDARLIVADIDTALLRHERLSSSTWADAARMCAAQVRVVNSGATRKAVSKHAALLRDVDAAPFVPDGKEERSVRCAEIISIQSAGLQQRLVATGCKSLVVGVSGGLDSTLALLVASHAFEALGLDKKGIYGITMPGFGTTGRTYDNATSLISNLGATLKEISIVDAVNLHFKDIDHDPSQKDVTYENSQARERTQILMDYANKVGGMVLGTGDLSELALGWCTYNGDQMSMYGVNASIPKTLVKYLVEYFADSATDAVLKRTLADIVDTPISPELLPASADDSIEQKTEDLVGPYRLHDFLLYHVLRNGFTPAKIFMLASKAFKGEFSEDVIKHWMIVFYRRFFNQQFKRSCVPDGPKVGSVCLSPRGDWRMPSDAVARLWLEQCESL